MSDWIEILTSDLDIAKAVEFVADPAAGGIATFLGTTRAEESLVALDYEAYNEMAMQQLRSLAAQARQRWPIVRLAVLHRVGRVEVKQSSVVIAVSTPHRADAFEACRFLIDSLKKDVAIWKKEVFADGSGQWVHPTTS